MDEFLLDFCFNSGYEGLKFKESTPRHVAWQGVDFTNF
jgi:hypothetical protein